MRLCALLLTSLGWAAPLSAAEPPGLLLFTTTPLSSDVPAALPPKVDELLASAVASRAELRSVALPGRGPSRSLTAPLQPAREALAKARSEYAAFRFDRAAAEAMRAADLIEADAIPPGELETLSAALVQAAIAHDAAGQTEAARGDCARVMRLRPDLLLDRVRVPPRVVGACEAERAKLGRAARRRVRILTNPPLVPIYVDGVARGNTPLTIDLVSGAHGIILAPEQLAPLRDKLSVEAGSEPIERRFELNEDPVDRARSELAAALSRRGPLPQTVAAAVALGRLVKADWVVLSGIERGAKGGWRLSVARIDVTRERLEGRWLTVLGADLADASARTTAVAQSLASGAAGVEPVLLPGSESESASLRGLDFAGAVYGSPKAQSGQPVVAVAVTTPGAKPRRRGVWIAVGTTLAVVVAGGVAVGLALGLKSSTPPDEWVIHVPAR